MDIRLSTRIQGTLEMQEMLRAEPQSAVEGLVGPVTHSATMARMTVRMVTTTAAANTATNATSTATNATSTATMTTTTETTKIATTIMTTTVTVSRTSESTESELDRRKTIKMYHHSRQVLTTCTTVRVDGRCGLYVFTSQQFVSVCRRNTQHISKERGSQ